MEQRNRDNKRSEPTYSTRVKAGRRRTYFIDVRPTRADEFYITITESKKLNNDTYEKHKIFIYKEDFNKFLLGLTDTINHIKTELMPGVDFEQFDRKEYYSNSGENSNDNYGNDGYNNEAAEEPARERHEDGIPKTPQNTTPPPPPPAPSAPMSDDDLKW